MSDYTMSPCLKSSEKHLYRRKIHTSINSWPWSLQINEPWARDPMEKTSAWSAVNFKKHKISSSKPEPAIWSHDTGQRIPCFDRRQLTIALMFNIKDTHCKPRLQDLVLTRVRPPCCPTSSLGARARDPFLPWVKSCLGVCFVHCLLGFLFLCMWSFSYSCGAPLGGPSGLRSSAKNTPF